MCASLRCIIILFKYRDNELLDTAFETFVCSGFDRDMCVLSIFPSLSMSLAVLCFDIDSIMKADTIIPNTVWT